MSHQDSNGHPRTRGARSRFYDEELVPGSIPVQYGMFRSFDGSSIFYCEEGKGKPLVFAYGIACSSLHWTYQIDYFRKNYRCIWFDYRGHRRTPIPDRLETLTVEACVKDLRSLLDHLGIQKAVLLGHSMGVSVSMKFAHEFPDMTEMLILANGTARKPLETLLGGNFLQPAFKVLSAIQKQKPDWISAGWKIQEKTKIIGQILGSLGFNSHLVHPKDIFTYGRQMAELPPVVLTRMMDDYQNFDATPWLHEVKAKTLILSGESDQITPPRTQDLIHQLMQNSQLVRIQHGSHCCTLDMPDYINLLIEKFLNQASYSS